VRTLIDTALAAFPVVWAAAGTSHTVFPTTSYQELGLQPDRGPRPAELREGPPPAAVAGHRGRRAAQSNRSAGTASAPEWAGGGREGSAGEDRHAVTLGERAQICEQATAAAARATEQTQASASTDPHAVADAAWAASDFLSVAGRVVEGRRGGPLTDAAGEYDRAARESWGRIPAPSSAG